MPKAPIPKEIEQYFEYINNTGGNDPGELWEGETNIEINAPLALIEFGVQCQIVLLYRLHKEGLLKEAG